MPAGGLTQVESTWGSCIRCVMRPRLIGCQALSELTGALKGVQEGEFTRGVLRELFKGGVIEVCVLRCATRFLLRREL